MKKALFASAAALALAVASPAVAGQQGWYVGVEGGWSDVETFDVENPSYKEEVSKDFIFGAKNQNTVADVNSGWAAFLTAGKKMGNWRVEGELGYRHNTVDFTTSGTSWCWEDDYEGDAYAAKLNSFSSCPYSFVTGGRLTEWTGMVNVIRDVNLNKRFTASIGVGAGADRAKLTTAWGSESDTVFAAQALFGLSYEISPRWDLTANYRYLWVDSPDLGSSYFKESDFEYGDLNKHAVTVGLRYSLNEPAKPVAVFIPPPPPPAPTPTQFIVFFGFDRCDITGAADRVLADAADVAKKTGSASVTIVGHTDSMGSVQYNARLSECRAGAVRGTLVAKGVSDGSISTFGKGESQLLISTGDEVKEPQNRRATVDLH